MGKQKERAVGIACRKCGCRHFATLSTRRRGAAIVRRRECRRCGHRVTTRETVVG